MNLVEKLRYDLGKFWSGFITKLQYNILSHTLILDIYIYEEGIKTCHKIVIKEISSYLFYDEYSTRSKNYNWDDEVELTSIEYAPQDIFFETISKDYPDAENVNIKGDFNIFIELWESALFIKANKLKINEEEFELE